LEVAMKQIVFSSNGVGNPERERLSLAEARHRALERRLKELDRRVYLTPSEQIEVAEIKKHKLRAKDEIATLQKLRF
jgi:uncharacterized protein YdcH (DUF465 family)